MDKVSVLFVCHGNICRSPMAQCVMQKLVEDAGIADRFIIDSCATTTEEIGNPLYPPARRKLSEKDIPLIKHRARKIRRDEAAGWDYIVCMDDENLWHLKRLLNPEDMQRVTTLLSYIGLDREVADPWYTGDFEATYRDVDDGCRALLAHICAGRGWRIVR